jgi:hypothetical protein
MAGKTFVNGREICGKASRGSSTAAFPDVCLSPPGPPAGPVPVPYAVTAQASDTTNGSITVQVGGKPVMLKDKSYFACCTGDEAATDSFGRSVITHQKRGKVYFVSWSLDVLIEGLNAVRHLDLCTHNHASQTGSTPPWPYLAEAYRGPPKPGDDGPCADERKRSLDDQGKPPPCPQVKPKPKIPEGLLALRREKRAFKLANDQAGMNDVDQRVIEYKQGKDYGDYKKGVTQFYRDHDAAIAADDRQRATRCMLRPYKPSQCCPGQTPHHIINASAFFTKGRSLEDDGSNQQSYPVPNGKPAYSADDAPCICVEGHSQKTANHGLCHTFEADAVHKHIRRTAAATISYAEAREIGIKSVRKVFVESGCSAECLRQQLDNYHKDGCGIGDKTVIRASPSKDVTRKDVIYANRKVRQRKNRFEDGHDGMSRFE